MNTAKSTDALGTSSSCFIHKITKNLKIVGNNDTFHKEDNLGLSSTIRVSSSDQGKNAKLVAALSYTSESGDSSLLFMRDNLSWIAWDGDSKTLMNAEVVTLGEEQNFDIFNGALVGSKGQYVVSVGYILDDGSVIYNAERMYFNVSD